MAAATGFVASWHAAAPTTLLVLAAVAWAGTLLAAAVMGAEALAAWRTETARDRRLWLAALGVAALVRWLTPFDLVRVFTGWQLLGAGFTETPLPRYGAGFAALLRPAVMVHADPEWWITVINASLGVATVAGLSLAVSRWRQRPALLPVAAWALALLPVLVRHHRSESALVVAMFAWLVGASAYARWLRSGRRMFAWLAVAPLLAAAYTRPAFTLALPATLVALHRWLPRSAQRSRRIARHLRRHRRWLWATILWLLIPHLLWLGVGGTARAQQGDLPAAHSPWFVLQLPVMLVGLNLALWPHAYPLVGTWFGLSGGWRAWRSRARSRASGWPLLAATLVVGVALLIPGMADPVGVSLPRLQAPWLALWTLVCCSFAAAQLSGCAARSADAAAPNPGDAAAAAARPGNAWFGPWSCALVVAVSALLTLPWLFRSENADHEDRALRAVATHLAGARGTLHWLAAGDSGHDKVSRHYPYWRFRPPHTRLRLAPLRDAPIASLRRADGYAAGSHTTDADGGHWVWLGTRCFARHRPRGGSPPDSYEQPACARLRPHLVPVLEWEVPNHGGVHFPWWSNAATLRVGLYRVP